LVVVGIPSLHGGWRLLEDRKKKETENTTLVAVTPSRQTARTNERTNVRTTKEADKARSAKKKKRTRRLTTDVRRRESTRSREEHDEACDLIWLIETTSHERHAGVS